MTTATFFELQRVRVASTSDTLAEQIRRRQFQRASGDKGDTSPMPYHSHRSRHINPAIGNYMLYKIRVD